MVGLVGRVAWLGMVALGAMAFAQPDPRTLRDRRDLPGLRDQQGAPIFRSSSSDLVVLPVFVTERDNKYVADLPRERFTVYDNGRKVPVEFFSNQDTPVTIGLIIDTSSSMRYKLGEVIAAASAFARSSNPEDELFAMAFNDDVRDALPDRRFLLASDVGSLNTALRSLVAEGRTSLYDGLMEGLDRVRTGTKPRKALVLISDGGDNASLATLEQVLSRAHTSNAAIYTVGLFDDLDPDKNPSTLKKLAKETGGERFLPRTSGALLAACEHIAREIRSGYTIGYVPPDRDGAFHRVRVDVATTGKQKLTVRTRSGYFAARQAMH